MAERFYANRPWGWWDVDGVVANSVHILDSEQEYLDLSSLPGDMIQQNVMEIVEFVTAKKLKKFVASCSLGKEAAIADLLKFIRSGSLTRAASIQIDLPSTAPVPKATRIVTEAKEILRESCGKYFTGRGR